MKTLISKLMRWLVRYLILLILLLMSFFILVLFYLYYPVMEDPSKKFIERRGAIESVDEKFEKTVGEVRHEVIIHSSTGLKVRLKILRSAKIINKQPLVLVLGGYRTGSDAIDLAKPIPGVILAALSYPFQGDIPRSKTDIILNLHKLQNTVFDTPPAVLLAIEYLASQTFVNDRRIELVGASLGAFFVAIPAALEKRVSRLWLIHGAGQPEIVLEYRLKKYLYNDFLRKHTAKFIATLFGSKYLAPEIWLPRMGDRPVMVINGRQDIEFPDGTVVALHQALPKNGEVIWMQGQHVKPHRKQIIENIISLVISRVTH